jgi:hypothetical protein
MVAIVFSSCRKINEATELGGGIIPLIDGVNTFDTIITVQAYNDTFGLANDSQYLSKGEEFFLGRINNDPLFGKTDARIFMELKPPVFPYYFANRPDSLTIDSVVLVLDYVETYGDTMIPQTINVYEMDQSNNFRSDTAYLVRQNPFTYSTLLGSRTFAPNILNDSIKVYKDTTKNQMRIRLDNSFGTRLLNYDSTGASGAYKTDSVFRTKFKGFAIQSMGPGNAIMGFNLAGANTFLAIYYKYEKRVLPNVPQPDTTVAYFLFSSNTAAANYVGRDYSGTPLLASIQNPPTTPDDLIYIQGSPGTFATIKIPALAGLSNRLVHRAELIVEQLYDVTDSMFPPPDLLYLDAHDPTITRNYKYRTIPYDLGLTSSGALNLGALGIFPHIGPDGSGHNVRTWKFNISRYVQHVLTNTVPLYDLRLSAPFTLNEQFGVPPGPDVTVGISVDGVSFNPTIAKGRVRLIGDNGTNQSRRIRLRLIYSKI